ncbi:MAG TPA: hypothetical protein PL060_05700 [bacterium]|nr:hypothetical protein [bacterium]
MATFQLKQAKLLNIQSIAEAQYEIIEQLIRPSGFYKQKAKTLKEIANFFISGYTMKKSEIFETSLLRKQLLSINGIGQETADDILLYAFERPIFVIDEYTKRFVRRHNLSKQFSYESLQKLFENSLKKDYKIYQDYHALIVIEMKNNDKNRHSNIYP